MLPQFKSEQFKYDQQRREFTAKFDTLVIDPGSSFEMVSQWTGKVVTFKITSVTYTDWHNKQRMARLRSVGELDRLEGDLVNLKYICEEQQLTCIVASN